MKLSHMSGVAVQRVAHALDIHPFMLSRWRKEVREGVLRGRARRVDVPSRSARDIKQLPTLKREHAMLKEEHELLKNLMAHYGTLPAPLGPIVPVIRGTVGGTLAITARTASS